LSRLYDAGQALARHLVVEHAYVPLEQALPGLSGVSSSFDVALAAFEGPDLRVHAVLLDEDAGDPALPTEGLRQALQSQEERIPGRIKAYVWVITVDEARAKALQADYLHFEDGHFLSKTLVGRGVLNIETPRTFALGRLAPKPSAEVLAHALDPAGAPDEQVARREIVLRQADERQARRLLKGGLKPVVWFLVSANIVAYGLQHFVARAFEVQGVGTDEAWGQAAILLGANLPGLTLGRQELWRLVSSCFLHDNLAHITLNMLSLFSLGGIAERLCGPWRFLTLYALCGLGGSVLSAFLNTQGGASLGASGAIVGLAGALLAPRWRRDPRFPKDLSDRLFSWLARPVFLIFALGFGLNFMGLPVRLDNFAHLGGLLTGFGIAYIYPPLLIHKTDRKV
jgi:membrane associated rhomboid family serine protease